jgi:hypothetical protein
VDLIGKERQIRTVPVSNWVKETLDAWLSATGIESGSAIPMCLSGGKLWGDGILGKKLFAPQLDVNRLLGNLDCSFSFFDRYFKNIAGNHRFPAIGLQRRIRGCRHPGVEDRDQCKAVPASLMDQGR